MKVRNRGNRIDKVSIGLNKVHLILLAGLAIVLVACSGGGGSDSDPSNDAGLSSLVLSAGDLAPSFESGTTGYSLTVDNAITSTTVTPTTSDSNATSTVDGVAVTSGTASADITLVEGDNTITIVVTAEDGTTSRTYTVTVNRLPPPITSFELIDPTPGAGDQFGQQVVKLANGNIVVSDPNDSSLAENNGAVHLYDPRAQTLVASYYGNGSTDKAGAASITGLSNGNFVISFERDDVNGIVDAGSVMLVNGLTGAQIGSSIAGDDPDDFFGKITAMANGNYVIASGNDDIGGLTNAGSVRLVSGETGVQIGGAIIGDTASDFIGGVIALANGNYVIRSQSDDVGGIVNAGSVRLMDGATGGQIGTTIAGDNPTDQLGSAGIYPLSNDNFIINSRDDDVGGIVDAGSVRLVDGATGAQINIIAGDNANDQIGRSLIFALENGNYVIASGNDDVNGIVDAGSVRLISGTTGDQIGNIIAGDNEEDRLGQGGATVLANNNFVMTSTFDDVGGIVNAGSVRLVDGSTGSQIGNAISGDDVEDRFGSSRVTALANGNYVIAAQNDDVGVIVDAGSVRLVDGSSGVQIGNPIEGDTAFDFLGRNGITALANNNFVIASAFDDENGIFDAGTVRLVNGATGVQINSIVGDLAQDNLGLIGFTLRGVTALANGDFVIASSLDDENGIVDAGSVGRADGITGNQIGSSLTGNTSNDFERVSVTGSSNGDFYILSVWLADNNGLVDSGLVRLIAE